MMNNSSNIKHDSELLKSLKDRNFSGLENKKSSETNWRHYYGHGKLLLTGEYLVMDGAKGLALPTILGQALSVKSKKTFMTPKLIWRSYSYQGDIWLEVEFELWRFDIVKGGRNETALKLQSILRKARELNPHFLREVDSEIIAEAKVEFPLNWGLGSSSTLAYNIAQWAYISPFELGRAIFGGSGYDIACAQSVTPILFQRDTESQMPSWQVVNFKPSFMENLFFVHLGNKQLTSEEILYYQQLDRESLAHRNAVSAISNISEEILETKSVSEFNDLLEKHESITSKILRYPKIKDQYFSNFKGQVKSLGAWGGDFVLASTKEDLNYAESYFKGKGLSIIIPYNNLISDQFMTNWVNPNPSYEH